MKLQSIIDDILLMEGLLKLPEIKEQDEAYFKEYGISKPTSKKRLGELSSEILKYNREFSKAKPGYEKEYKKAYTKTAHNKTHRKVGETPAKFKKRTDSASSGATFRKGEKLSKGLDAHYSKVINNIFDVIESYYATDSKFKYEFSNGGDGHDYSNLMHLYTAKPGVKITKSNAGVMSLSNPTHIKVGNARMISHISAKPLFTDGCGYEGNSCNSEWYTSTDWSDEYEEFADDVLAELEDSLASGYTEGEKELLMDFIDDMKESKDIYNKLNYVAWINDKSSESDAFDDFLGDKETVQSTYSKFRNMMDKKLKFK